MIEIFISSVIFAILGVTLFFGKSIGLSMVLFAVPIAYFIIHLLEKNNKIANKKAKVLIIPIALLSVTYLIYNNQFFNILNIIIIPLLIIIMILELFSEKLELKANLLSKILIVPFEALELIGESIAKLRMTIEDKFNLEQKKDRKYKKVIKAILITIPVVLVILILLSTADAVFGRLFINIADYIVDVVRSMKLSTIIIKLVLIVCSSIYLLSFFDYISSRYEPMRDVINTEQKKKDNFTIRMILGVLNIIYLLFCIIQIKSLFMRSVDINYADYARQGFFQLMIVSVINLVTILVAKQMENKEEIKQNRYINIMCVIMILFTFIILISSAYRMYLYESAYGYTLLRLLVYCSLFTESILLIPTIIYILDKKINLAKTYFYIIITVYLCMNFANFDNIIAKRNVNRYLGTGKIDIEYLRHHTNTDSIKQITRLLEINYENDNIKSETKEYLSKTYRDLENERMDFRNFNISKFYAKNLIKKLNIEPSVTQQSDTLENNTNEDFNWKNDKISYEEDITNNLD